jgi:stage II sporulation protein AA (anti-sigma F factor antagonist)
MLFAAYQNMEAMRVPHAAIGPPVILTDEIVLPVNGALDMAACPRLREQIDDLLDRYPRRHLVLDLSGVPFMDSSGVGLVLGRYRRLEARQLRLRLVGVRPPVARVLRMSGLHGIMTIEETEHPEQRGGW